MCRLTAKQLIDAFSLIKSPLAIFDKDKRSTEHNSKLSRALGYAMLSRDFAGEKMKATKRHW